MSISISYEETGRTSQKARTRAALIDAARSLIQSGTTPTVEDVAEAASISRATAYRYFPNRHLLLVAAHPEVETESLLGPEPPTDPSERLDCVVRELARMILDAERSYRTMLRLSLEGEATDATELTLRKGRRYPWIEDALSPVRERMAPQAFRRLVHAVSLGVGVEAIGTLVDLAGLTRERAVQVMRWSAQALLRTALDEVEENGRARP